MVLYDIKQLALGGMTSDAVIRRDIERQVLYRKASTLSVGTKLLPTKTFGVLDVKFQFPGDMTGQYPVPEGGIAKMENIVWTDFNTTLEKGQVRYQITDEAKARQLEDYQRQTGRRKAAEALATLLDKHIIDTVIAGTHSGNNVTVGAGDEWNGGGANADPEGDIVEAVNNIVSNSFVQLEEIRNIQMLVPAPVWGSLRKLMLIGNVQQRLEDYFKTALDVTTLPTRYTDAISGNPAGISDDAYLVVNSEDTGIIGNFNPPPGAGIPMTEEWRENGIGDNYLFTNYFKAKIQPYSSTDAYSHQIAKILNVC